MEQIEFGEKLKKQREEKGMTQQTLADRLYVTRQAVSRWECGARYPDLMTAKKIAIELDTTIDELVSGEACKRDVEKEPVLATSVTCFIQTALYAIALIPCIFQCFFCIREYFPSGIYEGIPREEVIAFLVGGTIGYVLITLAMGLGLYYSIRNELSPKRIGMIMSMTFLKDIIVNLVLLIDVGTKSIRIDRLWTADYDINPVINVVIYAIALGCYMVAAIVVIRFFSGNYKVRIGTVYVSASLYIFQVLYGITRMTYYMNIEYYLISVVRIFGEVAIVVLLIYQARVLNQKRKLTKVI